MILTSTRWRKEGTGRFDASAVPRAPVGQGSFWTAMIEYMKEGPDSLKSKLTRGRRSELAQRLAGTPTSDGGATASRSLPASAP